MEQQILVEKNPKAIESLSLMSDKKFAQKPQSEET